MTESGADASRAGARGPRAARWQGACALALLALPAAACAQPPSVSLDLGGEPAYLRLLLLFASVSLAPALLAVLTSFARIVVVLLFLRAGLGAHEIPPTYVLVGLAILLTLLSMSGTLQPIYDNAVAPLLDGRGDLSAAAQAAQGPLREFLLGQARPADLALMAGLAEPSPADSQDSPLSVLAAAFVISELRIAFLIGFIIYLPFVVIDLVVASTLASVGMLTLPAPLLSLPFKVLLFVMVDGWQLLTQALVTSIR